MLMREVSLRLQRAGQTAFPVVASVAVIANGDLLMGRRRDSGKWCLPGGHLELDESPYEAAYRELREETGIDTWHLYSLGYEKVIGATGRPVGVHAFRVDLYKKPLSLKFDPDKEFSELKWVNAFMPPPYQAPELDPSKLHNKQDVVLKYLGVQDWPGYEQRRK